MTRYFIVAGLLLAASCSQQDPATPPASNDAAAEKSAPVDEVPSLEGNWRVTSVGGVADAAGIGMTASFANGVVNISTGCLRRAWTYTQKRNVVAFAASPGGSSNCGGSPSAGEETAYAALAEANIAIFSKEGKEASLSGTGGTLTLERR